MSEKELLAEIIKRLNKLEKNQKKRNEPKITKSDGCTRIPSMGDDDGCIGYKEGLSGWL